MRYVGEVLELTQDCELGKSDERCVVLELWGQSITLVFPNREANAAPGYTVRIVRTGADYRYVRRV